MEKEMGPYLDPIRKEKGSNVNGVIFHIQNINIAANNYEHNGLGQLHVTACVSLYTSHWLVNYALHWAPADNTVPNLRSIWSTQPH